MKTWAEVNVDPPMNRAAPSSVTTSRRAHRSAGGGSIHHPGTSGSTGSTHIGWGSPSAPQLVAWATIVADGDTIVWQGDTATLSGSSDSAGPDPSIAAMQRPPRALYQQGELIQHSAVLQSRIEGSSTLIPLAAK